MQRGLTAAEGLVAIVCVLVLATLVYIVATSRGPRVESKVECMNNVRNIIGLIEYGPRTAHGGTDLILYLVEKGEIDLTEDHLSLLFCPGDKRESLSRAGGPARYKSLKLGEPNGHLTSYAGCDAAKRPTLGTYVLIADDSGDHHEGGIVVGYAGGSVMARWRHGFEDYGVEGELTVGPGSQVEELRCLKVD